FGFVFGPGAKNLPVVYGTSNYYHLGLLYKFRFNDRWSVGADVGYTRAWYVIRQDSSKSFPNRNLYNNERYIYPMFNFRGFVRLNFGRQRGNVMGTFVDFGPELLATLNPKNRVRFLDPANGQSIEVTRANLGFVNPALAGAFLRIGWKRYMLFVSYRINEAFRIKELPRFTDEKYSTLPPIMTGFSIGLY
ncbi:MAG: hypothetical protein RMM53_03990, partial [Bacteroidia bacterium]|nr:hypothetical protein [Bacteroidia bacterium]